jgi:hypothetical protein
MGDFMNVVIAVIILIAACVLTQFGVVWKTRRACLTIIKDLRTRGAYDPESATALPYAQKKGFFHFGARDYKPHALQHLVQKEIVCLTDDGRFYLGAKAQDVRF